MTIFDRGDLLWYKSVRGGMIKVKALDRTLSNGFTTVVVTSRTNTAHPRGTFFLASPMWLSRRKTRKRKD